MTEPTQAPLPLDDDYRPSKLHLSNSEIRATGLLAGGAVLNIARELIQARAQLEHKDKQIAEARNLLNPVATTFKTKAWQADRKAWLSSTAGKE